VGRVGDGIARTQGCHSISRYRCPDPLVN
jgi:hypothetical protein